jgi:hypothetical protein
MAHVPGFRFEISRHIIHQRLARKVSDFGYKTGVTNLKQSNRSTTDLYVLFLYTCQAHLLAYFDLTETCTRNDCFKY